MAADEKAPFPDLISQMPETFADRDFPVFVVDTPTGIFNAGGMVRVTLCRVEPEMFGRPIDTQKPRFTPMLQLAMSASSYVAISVIFAHHVKQMVDTGAFPREVYEQVEAQIKVQKTAES